MNNEQKAYTDWLYGKIQGMLDALFSQGIITEQLYNRLEDLIHQTDRYRECLERQVRVDNTKRIITNPDDTNTTTKGE